MPETAIVGRSADDIIESKAGGLEHRAVVLLELGSGVETAREEFRYDEDDEAAAEIVRLCVELDALLGRVSIDEATARLTFNRECARCDGRRRFPDGDPCIECGGKGYVRPGETNG
jgi:hypothetical protein